MKFLYVVCVLGFLASVVLGVTLRRFDLVLTTWPQEPRESLALTGIQGLLRDVDDQVAPVISDARTRQAVIAFVMQRGQVIARAQQDLLDDAQKRCGVAVVPSGSLWVRKGS